MRYGPQELVTLAHISISSLEGDLRTVFLFVGRFLPRERRENPRPKSSPINLVPYREDGLSATPFSNSSPTLSCGSDP